MTSALTMAKVALREAIASSRKKRSKYGAKPTVAMTRASPIIRIDMPPSLNNAFFNRKSGGRAKTADYTAWGNVARFAIITQCPQPRLVKPPYRVNISLPVKMRGDASNRIKAIEDALVNAGVMSDDSKVMFVCAHRNWAEADKCAVVVSTYKARRR